LTNCEEEDAFSFFFHIPLLLPAQFDFSITLVTEASTMFSQVQPYSSFLKAFEILGFNFKQNSWKRNFLSVIIAFPAMLYCLLATLSILQSKNLEDLTNRLLFIPAIVGMVLKTINVIVKFEDFKMLMKNFNEAFKDKKLEKNLLIVSRKMNLLFKMQYVAIAIAGAIAIISSYVTRELMVPFYVANIPNHENAVYWFNKFIHDCGIAYAINILILCDLLPVCLMAALAEHCRYINESFSELISSKGMHADFINCIKLHRKQHK